MKEYSDCKMTERIANWFKTFSPQPMIICGMRKELEDHMHGGKPSRDGCWAMAFRDLRFQNIVRTVPTPSIRDLVGPFGPDAEFID